MRARVMRNSNQILLGDQPVDKRNFFAGSTTPPALAKNWCDTNDDAQSVCGS